MAAIDWTRESSNRPGGADPGAADDAAPAEARARAAVFSLPTRSGVAGARIATALPSDLEGAPPAAAAPAPGASAAPAGPRAETQNTPAASAQPFTGFSMSLATGQNAAGVIQTTGDLADAFWTVSTADHYKQAPIAFTVAPGDADWFPGTGQSNPGWFANGPNSCWIAADPDNTDNGKVTYTITFDLTGYNPADATLVGGQFSIDDQGVVVLNGHQLGSSPEGGWTAFHALSNGAGDFVAGVNTLVIETTESDGFLEAARLEGTVVDTVTTNPPGPDHWSKAISGDFATAKNWSGGFVPSSNNDAILDAAGSKAYTVTSGDAETVGSIQTAANATLSITAGVFQALSGTGAGANAGAIDVGDGAGMSVGGSLDNSGVILLAGNGAGGSLTITADTTLSGAGQLTLSDTFTNVITGDGSDASLTNFDNTISGAGTIGGGGLSLIINEAAGVIDATGTNRLSTGSQDVYNAGLIEATGTGGLFLANAFLNGSFGGTLLAADGSRVVLHDTTLIGGTLASAGSGLVRTGGRANGLDGENSAVTNAATLRVASHSALTLDGAIDNTGLIQLRGFGGAPTVFIGVDGVTLSGAGRVTTGDNVGDTIVGAAFDSTLTNLDNTIAGGGVLGGGKMILINAAAGVIDGDAAVGLTIDTGANTVANAGLIEAGQSGGLTVVSALDNTGQLLAAGGGVLTLDGDVTGAGTATIHNGTLDAAGAFSEDVAFAGGSGRLDLAQSLSYGGTISGFSRRGGTSLDLGDIAFVSANEATWSDGVLTVTDGTHTAQIDLAGTFGRHSFVAGDDGHGGTLVVNTSREAQSPAAQLPGSQAHRFAAAMASLAHPAATGAAGAQPHTPDHLLLLVAPRLRYA